MVAWLVIRRVFLFVSFSFDFCYQMHFRIEAKRNGSRRREVNMLDVWQVCRCPEAEA